MKTFVIFHLAFSNAIFAHAWTASELFKNWQYWLLFSSKQKQKRSLKKNLDFF
jgi:hypothetical protein